MKNQRVGIFLAHSLLAVGDEKEYVAGISSSLVENFKKIKPLVNELVSLGYVVEVLISSGQSGIESELGIPSVIFQSRAELFGAVFNHSFDFFLVWNGFDFVSKKFESWCFSERIPILYLEYGFFLQKNYIRFDFRGLLASSILPTSKELSSISSRNLDDWYSSCISLFENSAGFKLRDAHFIDRDLVVLQTDYDSSLVHFSPFSTALEFLNYLRDGGLNFDSCDFRIHPNVKGSARDKIVDMVGQERIDDISNGLVSAFSHRRILGVNSTLLSESVCIGRSPIVFGMCYGTPHYNDGFQFLNSGFADPTPTVELRKRVYFAHQYLQFHEAHGFTPDARHKLMEALLGGA